MYVLLVLMSGIEPPTFSTSRSCSSAELREYKYSGSVHPSSRLCTPPYPSIVGFGYYTEFLLVDTSADTPQSEREVPHCCELPIVTLFCRNKERQVYSRRLQTNGTHDRTRTCIKRLRRAVPIDYATWAFLKVFLNLFYIYYTIIFIESQDLFFINL